MLKISISFANLILTGVLSEFNSTQFTLENVDSVEIVYLLLCIFNRLQQFHKRVPNGYWLQAIVDAAKNAFQ